MPDERFEQMNALLIKIEHATAFKPGNVGERRADVVLPRLDCLDCQRC